MKSIILSLFMLMLIVGCSDTPKENDTNSTKVKGETIKSVSESNNNENNESVDSKNQTDNSKDEESKNTGLSEYRPEVGVEKKFYEGDYLVYTEKIIAANDEFVQRVIYIGEAPTVQVIKWTANEITIVFESTDVADPTVNILNDFEKIEQSTAGSTNDKKETLIGEGAIWEVKETKAKVEVPYGTYEDVYVITKTTNEVENADTIYTYYLAQGIGWIKDGFEVTGDQGYTVESVLKEVK